MLQIVESSDSDSDAGDPTEELPVLPNDRDRRADCCRDLDLER